MTESPSFLSNWIDSVFWKNGAFLALNDGDEIIFGKGGTTTLTEKFLDSSLPVFYLKDFYNNSYLAYIPESFVKIGKANALSWVNELAEEHPHISPVSNDDDIYEKDFSLLKSSFSKDLQKVVLISRETYLPFEKEVSIRRLLKKAFHFGSGSPYGFWNNHYGVIGSTPELLYHAKDGELTTFALAGTARKGEEEALLNSLKDRHEHNLVITDIKEKLEPFSHEVRFAETGIHPYKAIVHLKTDIKATLKKDVDFTGLTNLMSPTAALGGYPKESSLAFLKSTNYANKYPKRYFGSAFGVVTPEEKEFIVSIRNVQWEDQHLFIESGGGIVEESELQKEIQEIFLKRNTIRKHYL